jgi:hypothetical protein
MARCHPFRIQWDPKGLCKKCHDAADNVILRQPGRPARILGLEQHGSAELPRCCPKCHSLAESDGNTLHCLLCGTYWERTVGTASPLTRPEDDQRGRRPVPKEAMHAIDYGVV